MEWSRRRGDEQGSRVEEYIVLLWVLAAVSLMTALALGEPFFILAITAAAIAMWLTYRSGG